MSMMKMNYRASALPALSICGKYDGDVYTNNGTDANDAINNGILQHKLLASLISGKEDKTLPLTVSAYKNVLKAFHKITAVIVRYAPDAMVKSEVEITGFDGRGVADVVAWDGRKQVLIVIDYKSHESLKNYAPQVKWYAERWLEQTQHKKHVKRIYTGVLFGDTQHLQMEELLPQELSSDLSKIMALVSTNERKGVCQPSAWCAQCRKRGKCKAASDEINRVSEVLRPTVKTELSTSEVAEKLNAASEAEKRIRELKAYAKELLEAGEEIVDSTRSYGYTLQRITNFSIDFVSAYTHFAKNEQLLEKFLEKLTISKVDVETLLQEEFPEDAKRRSQTLKSLLSDPTPSTRLKRYLV